MERILSNARLPFGMRLALAAMIAVVITPSLAVIAEYVQFGGGGSSITDPVVRAASSYVDQGNRISVDPALNKASSLTREQIEALNEWISVLNGAVERGELDLSAGEPAAGLDNPFASSAGAWNNFWFGCNWYSCTLALRHDQVQALRTFLSWISAASFAARQANLCWYLSVYYGVGSVACQLASIAVSVGTWYLSSQLASKNVGGGVYMTFYFYGWFAVRTQY